MKKSQGPPHQPPNLQHDERTQRREIVMMLTSDDMKSRLKTLAQQGRQQECLALMQELGDWQSYGRGDLAPILHAPYLGRN